jgi:hypothetical protein
VIHFVALVIGYGMLLFWAMVFSAIVFVVGMAFVRAHLRRWRVDLRGSPKTPREEEEEAEAETTGIGALDLQALQRIHAACAIRHVPGATPAEIAHNLLIQELAPRG